MNAWMVMGMVIVTLLVGALYPNPRRHGAPRIIWTWRDKDTPYTHHARASWKRHNPDHVIRTLTPQTFQHYARVPVEISSHPVLSSYLEDIVRVTVLAENGGVWLDGTTVLHGPLDPWLFPPDVKQEKLMGFMQGNKVVTAFLAALPGCKWLAAWKDAWFQLMRYDSIQSYVTIKEKEGIPTSDLRNPLDHVGEIVWRTLKAPLSMFASEEMMDRHMTVR